MKILKQNGKQIGYFIVLMLMFLVWALFSLPFIFYYVEFKTSILKANKTDPRTNASECLDAVVYDGNDGKCELELLDALTESNCQIGSKQTILVQKDGLEQVTKIVQGLEFLGASESCLKEVKSFMCLYAYGLCSLSGENIQPTSGQCEELRDTLCQSEWASAIELGVDLPDCDQFPESPKNCPDSNSTGIITATNERNTSENNQSSPDTLLDCSESFYRENGSQVCIPSCYSWSLYGRKLSMIFDGVVIVMAIIGSIAIITILVISCIKPKRMCKFPAIFVVYMAVDLLIIEVLVLVSHVDRRTLHCSSRNLLESMKTVTPFCVITGVFFSYFLLQLAVWWFSHTAILFWNIYFPFHSQRFKDSGWLKCIHILCVTIGVIFPLVTIATSMIEFGVESSKKAGNTTSATELFLSGGLGYSPSKFPPVLCTASDENVVFYSLILPISIIQTVGSSMLILSIWHIHRENINKNLNSSYLYHFRTAEKKLFVVFFYFAIMLIGVLSAFSVDTRRKSESIEDLIDFFTCEQRGQDPNSPCYQPGSPEFELIDLLSDLIFGMFPVVMLVYAINVQEAKKALCPKQRQAN